MSRNLYKLAVITILIGIVIMIFVGYELKIKNLKTGKVFKGKDIEKYLKDGTNYKVICSKNLKINITPRASWNNHKFSAGELGCACSHISIWQDMIKNNKKSALILEDDAILQMNKHIAKNYLLGINTNFEANITKMGQII